MKIKIEIVSADSSIIKKLKVYRFTSFLFDFYIFLDLPSI